MAPTWRHFDRRLLAQPSDLFELQMVLTVLK
jgi:hypothetical protein